MTRPTSRGRVPAKPMQLSNPGTLTRRAALALSAAVVGSIGTGAAARCGPARVHPFCQFGSGKTAVACTGRMRRGAIRAMQGGLGARWLKDEGAR